MQALDLRARPPVAPFTSLRLFDTDSGLSQRLANRGYTLAESYREQSLEAFGRELATARLDGCIVHARSGNTRSGRVSSADASRIATTHPDVVRGFVGCVSAEVERAPAEVEECLALGALGVSLEPGLAEPAFLLDEPVGLDLCSIVAAAGLPLFVTGGDSGPLVTYASPHAIERAAQRFPSLNIVIVHGGWPWVREAIAVTLHQDNIWLMPDMYAGKGFPGHADYIEAANGVLRHRMLYGSSYPAVNIPEHVDAMFGDGLTEQAWQAMTVDNPRILFGERLVEAP